MRHQQLYRRYGSPSRCRRWHFTALLLNFGSVLFVLLLILACGGSFPPTSFVESSADSIGFISWQQGSRDSISGQWAQVTFDGVRSEPTSSSSGFTGHLENKEITVTIPTSFTTMTLSGTLQDSTLQFSVTNPTGQVGTQVWYAASQAQYNELVSVFTVNAHLQVALATLSATVAHPAADSDGRSYESAVHTASVYVGNLQDQENSIRSSSNPCGSTGIFDQLYPPDASLFQLTAYPTALLAIAHTTITQQLAVVQADWKEAQAQTIPDIANLHLPWKITARSENDIAQAGQHLYAALLLTLQQGYTSMNDLAHRSAQIGQEVERIKQAHGC